MLHEFGQGAAVECLAVSPQTGSVAACSANQIVLVDIHGRTLAAEKLNCSDVPTSVAILDFAREKGGRACPGVHVITGHESGALRVWLRAYGDTVRAAPAERKNIKKAAPNPDAESKAPSAPATGGADDAAPAPSEPVGQKPTDPKADDDDDDRKINNKSASLMRLQLVSEWTGQHAAAVVALLVDGMKLCSGDSIGGIRVWTAAAAAEKINPNAGGADASDELGEDDVILKVGAVKQC